MPEKIQICSQGVWDSTMPGIEFDVNGVSNYAKIFEKMLKEYPCGSEGQRIWENYVEEMSLKGKGKTYDCIIGVSGGTDSSYLLHLAKKYKLRALAVNLDNGWSSDIAVKNIKKLTSKLNIDLETYVIDYEEVKAVLRAYIKAGLPWVDSPTDIAIKAALYKAADREGIKYIFNGGDFRSEGLQPTEWTHGDAKQLNYIVKKYESIKLKSFPYYNIFDLVYYGYLKKIKMLRPYYFLTYQKKAAQKELNELYGWEYYGGHHHENLFTKFIIGCWLPQKFNIDKRKITLSAQVLSGEITRDEALVILSKPPYDEKQMIRDKELVIKKLDISEGEFQKIWYSKNKYYYDYPSYIPIYNKFSKIIKPLVKLILPFKPSSFEMIEMENKSN